MFWQMLSNFKLRGPKVVPISLCQGRRLTIKKAKDKTEFKH
jgi:hypothetical protein